jgi:hypothetical protein
MSIEQRLEQERHLEIIALEDNDQQAIAEHNRSMSQYYEYCSELHIEDILNLRYL